MEKLVLVRLSMKHICFSQSLLMKPSTGLVYCLFFISGMGVISLISGVDGMPHDKPIDSSAGFTILMAGLLCLYSLQAPQWNLDKPKRTMRFSFHRDPGALSPLWGTINLILTVGPKVTKFSHYFHNRELTSRYQSVKKRHWK